ncbi:E4, partial [Erinaceus europaeus papillomavirus 1]
ENIIPSDDPRPVKTGVDRLGALLDQWEDDLRTVRKELQQRLLTAYSGALGIQLF